MNAHKLIGICALVVGLGTGLGLAASVDTAITYQGQLQQSGSPAQGAFDLRFTLFDSLEGGTQVGATLATDAVPINHGLFTVNLDFGAGAFNGEARWLEIEVRATEPAGVFTRLTPRQPLTPVPYAIRAASAGQVAAEHITGTLADAQLPANPAFSGTVTAKRFAGDGSGLALLDRPGGYESITINTANWVGIGTADPMSKLHIAGWDSPWVPALRITAASEAVGAGIWLENTYQSKANAWSIYNDGGSRELVFGCETPLDVLRLSTNGTTFLHTLEAGAVKAAVFQGDGSGLANVARLNGPNAFNGNQTITGGNVGIGTTSPGAKLHIESGTLNEPALILSSESTGWGSGLKLENRAAKSTWGIYTYHEANSPVDGTLVIGHVQTERNALLVHKDGTTSVNVLQITGGGDIAEPFKVSAQEILPGQVVCIDPQQPGALCLSTRAYDPTVAGIVSGANGIKAGMILRQEDTVADGTHPVALTGRVWCYGDADAGGPIRPGDLLTTADTPGHAMKAADRERAFGAILGKAMSPLEQGQGLVLVLVSLQ